MTQYQWVLCPICGGKTRTKIRPDTEAKNLIVFCPKCKNEFAMDINNMEFTLSKGPELVSEKGLPVEDCIGKRYSIYGNR